MNKKEFTQSLKGKTVAALLELLKLGQTGKQKIDPDFLGAIIDELNERTLSDSEAKEFENILNISADENLYEPEKSKGQFSKDEITEITVKNENREPGRYTALKSVTGFISILGYIVIVCGIIALIYLSSNGSAPIGFVLARTHNIRLKEILKRRALFGNQTVVLLTNSCGNTNSGASNPFFLKLL